VNATGLMHEEALGMREVEDRGVSDTGVISWVRKSLKASKGLQVLNLLRRPCRYK